MTRPLFVWFFVKGQFCDIAKVVIIHRKDLANFGYVKMRPQIAI
jgi:hypothetical protein